MILLSGIASAENPDSLPQRRYMHGIGAEFRPEYIAPTNPFLKGRNLAGQSPASSTMAGRPIELSLSAHLRYSFRFTPGSCPDRVYGGVYQGIGAAYYSFGNKRELGNPVAVYLFQGARLTRISRRLSLNYEWNFGLSFGWKPYDKQTNPFNVMMGSKMNAYINVDFYFNWMLTSKLDLTAGLSMTHFSNGNTKIPNAGLNTIGMKVGLLYNFGRTDNPLNRPLQQMRPPEFPRHVSYDLVLFGSWRRKGVEIDGKLYATPDAYGVLGFNFAAMYNFGYKFRAGLSLDGVYDGSANVYTEDYIVEVGGSDPGHQFHTPSLDKQIALGVSARGEFVMPYFTVGIGLGVNALHRGGDLKAFYQMLTLKIAATRRTFIHVGYCLKNFQTPNYLMLGVGFRFNNKYPVLR
ncbi:acyloxyacyl hydrolase [uncultured Alistipes sp.]|uniref:acyloxyacyl hydrolase n=1 Tax=uncultured Alistipes sp. TaxID=538949 RepID=UPI0025E57A2B|nr:acyloxyacyl hydrolase [uncultured Alistipes sp.]